jgi:hypothetical protein
MTENDMTGLLLKLADLGVTGIKIFYSGGGDSGAIDDIVYTTKEIEDIEDINYLENFGNEVVFLKDLDSALNADIENFAEEKILSDIEDWWNNDGGYGVMLISVPSGDYKIDNNIYIANTEEYYHDGNLIDQSLN